MPSARSTFIGLLVAGSLVLVACGDSGSKSSSTNAAATTAAATATTAGGAATTAAGGAVTGSVTASDQTSDGTTITVAKVSITGSAGFIAVHSDTDGKPGPVVGHVAVPQGDSSNVVVKLDSKVASGAYWPMLHVDAGKPGVYEFPGPDVPVKSGSDIVMQKITLTVNG